MPNLFSKKSVFGATFSTFTTSEDVGFEPASLDIIVQGVSSTDVIFEMARTDRNKGFQEKFFLYILTTTS